MATPLILTASSRLHPDSVLVSNQFAAWYPRSLSASAVFAGLDRVENQDRGAKINNRQSHVEGYPTG